MRRTPRVKYVQKVDVIHDQQKMFMINDPKNQAERPLEYYDAEKVLRVCEPNQKPSKIVEHILREMTPEFVSKDDQNQTLLFDRNEQRIKNKKRPSYLKRGIPKESDIWNQLNNYNKEIFDLKTIKPSAPRELNQALNHRDYPTQRRNSSTETQTGFSGNIFKIPNPSISGNQRSISSRPPSSGEILMKPIVLRATQRSPQTSPNPAVSFKHVPTVPQAAPKNALPEKPACQIAFKPISEKLPQFGPSQSRTRETSQKPSSPKKAYSRTPRGSRTNSRLVKRSSSRRLNSTNIDDLLCQNKTNKTFSGHEESEGYAQFLLKDPLTAQLKNMVNKDRKRSILRKKEVK